MSCLIKIAKSSYVLYNPSYVMLYGRKTQHYGITGISLSLIENYLIYRNWDSVVLQLKTGIPQGSIFGPLFFSMYVNDLNNLNIFSYSIYADDTTLYFKLEDSQ